MKKMFHEIRQRLEQGENLVLVTVIASSGATPRGAGARMLVGREGRICGTIGGGAVEYRSVKIAQKVLEEKSSRGQDFTLTREDVQNLGMICGGNCSVYFHFIAAHDAQAMAIALQADRAMEIPLRIHQDLREQHAGIWEGLPFEEIKKRWPELYDRRGDAPTLPPPGGEVLEDCARRFEGALKEILRKTEGSVAVVAHLTVIRAFLCGIQQIPMENIRMLSVSYGSVTRLCWEKGGWKVEEIGRMPI